MFQAATTIYNYSLVFLERFTQRRYWILELVIFVYIFDLFVGFPSFDLFYSDFLISWKNKYYYYADHLLEPLPFPPSSHESKMTFRLFLPVLIRYTGIPPVGVVLLKFFVGFLLLVLFARLVLEFTRDKVMTCLFTLAFGCINTPKCSADISGMIDSFGYFFLLVPFYYRRFLPVFSGVFLASWVDERGLIASSLVFLYLWFHVSKGRLGALLGLLLAWIAYFGIRFYLSYNYGLSTPHSDISINTLVNQVSTIGLGVWGALEGMWLIVVVALAYLLRERKFVHAFLFAGCTAIILLVASVVYDITRSMNYAYPAFLVALPFLIQRETRESMRKLAFLALLFSFLYPAYVVGGSNYIVWQLPLPLQLVRMFFL